MDLGLTSKLARVIVNGRTITRVEAAVAQLRRSVPRCDVQGIAADVATAGGCDSVIRAFPEIDVLVNNMGIFEPKPFEEISDAELPGPTASEGVGQFVAQMARSTGKDAATVEREFFQTVRPSSVLKRFTTTAEVAAMITYVCSAQASATTGAALRVDGGVVRAVA